MKCNYQPDITPQFEWARKELGVSLDEFKEVMSKIEITNPADRGLPAADLRGVGPGGRSRSTGQPDV